MRSGRAWCCEPACNFDLGILRHHRLWLPLGKHAQHTYDEEDAPRGRCPEEATMDVLYERCCGLDIHKRTVVACLVVPGPAGGTTKEVRSFGTMTDELLR